MSRTGAGTTIIGGINTTVLNAQTIPEGETLTFTHSDAAIGTGPLRAAYSVSVTQGNPGGGGVDYGGDLCAPFPQANPPVSVTQTNAQVQVANNLQVDLIVYTEIKWVENSEELDLINATDARITIQPPV